MTGGALSEASFQQQVIDVALLKGWKWFHAPRAQHRTREGRVYVENVTAGWPDLTLVRGDRMVCMELKSRTGKATAAQIGWIVALNAIPGVEAFVARPADLALIVNLLS